MKPIKTIAVQNNPDTSDLPTLSDPECNASLKLVIPVGQPGSGKSFLSQVIADSAGLLNSNDVFLADGEEGSNLVFSKLSVSKIQRVKLDSEKDIEKLVTRMDEKKHTKALIDTKGSSQESIKQAFGDFKTATESAVEIIPCIIVGSREGAETVGLDWLEILEDLPKIYWIWNCQRYGQKDERKLPDKLPCDASIVKQIRIPALRDDIAREIIANGYLMSDVVAGKITKSPLLSHRMVKPAVARWLTETKAALDPILKEFTE
jgi:hypothetical protein